MTETYLDFAFQSGALKTAVNGGSFTAIIELVKSINANSKIRLFATSGATGSSTYYVGTQDAVKGNTEEVARISRKIWTNDLSDSRFITKKNIFMPESVCDVDFLVDEIFAKQNPLNEERFANSETAYAYPTYDIDRHETVWLCNEIMAKHLGKDVPLIVVDKESPYLVLKAAMAIPFLYNKSVTIQGKRLIDGATEYPLPLLENISENSKTILLLSCPISFSKAKASAIWAETMSGYLLQFVARKEKLSFSVYQACAKRRFHEIKLLRKAVALQEKGRMLIISPKPRFNSNSPSNNSLKAIRQNFDDGYAAVSGRLEEIERFIES